MNKSIRSLVPGLRNPPLINSTLVRPLFFISSMAAAMFFLAGSTAITLFTSGAIAVVTFPQPAPISITISSGLGSLILMSLLINVGVLSKVYSPDGLIT